MCPIRTNPCHDPTAGCVASDDRPLQEDVEKRAMSNHQQLMEDINAHRDLRPVFDQLARERSQEVMAVLQYVFDHYGECRPDTHGDFLSWFNRLAERIRRSYY